MKYRYYGIMAVLMLVGASSAYAMGDKRQAFVGGPTLDTTPIQIQIGDAEYAIPANYFDLQPNPACRSERALFNVIFPDITPRTKENSREIDFGVGHDHKGGGILLSYHSSNEPEYNQEGSLRRIFSSRLENLISYEIFHNEYGLTRHTPKQGTLPWWGDELYVDHEKIPKRFLRCSMVDTVPVPVCSFYFYNKKLLVKASFNRKLLPEWETIEDNINKALDGFYVGPVTQEKPRCKDSYTDVVGGG